MTSWTPKRRAEQAERLRLKIAADPALHAENGRKGGVATAAVLRAKASMRREFSEAMSAKRANPEFNAAWLAAKRGQPKPVHIPPWVPDELVIEFKTIFRERGEYAACAWARAMKRNVRAAE